MKTKTIMIALLVLCGMLLNAVEQTAPAKAVKAKSPRFGVWLLGEALMPADSNYKDLYGSTIIAPKFKLSFQVAKFLHIFAGYSFTSKSGKIEILDLSIDAKSKQGFLTFGLGYDGKLSDKLGWYLEAGGASVSVKEEAMEETVSESLFGFMAEGGVIFKLGKMFRAQLHLGYISASKEINGQTVKPGGLSLGAGFGICF